MRSIGIASRALELMLMRCTDANKVAFGKQLYEHGTVVAAIAQSRMDIDQARLLVLSAALQVGPAPPPVESRSSRRFADPHPRAIVQIDLVRAKGAMKDIGMAKAVVPKLVGEVIDRAMQVHGAEGICRESRSESVCCSHPAPLVTLPARLKSVESRTLIRIALLPPQRTHPSLHFGLAFVRSVTQTVLMRSTFNRVSRVICTWGIPLSPSSPLGYLPVSPLNAFADHQLLSSFYPLFAPIYASPGLLRLTSRHVTLPRTRQLSLSLAHYPQSPSPCPPPAKSQSA